jgi:hypothetical protein
MEDYKKHLLHFMFVLGSVAPLSIGLFLIANGISNLRVSEITNQLTNVVNQIKSLEHSITRLNLQDFEDLISSMNSTLFILSSNLNNLQTNTPTSKSPNLP